MNIVREESIPVINYVGEVKDGDISDNQDVQRFFCSGDSFINGIGVTVLTGDYLPPLILAEVPLGDGIVQKYIVDGLQRTTALMKIRYGNHKFSGTIEDSNIEYQAKVLENGSPIKDDKGNFVWEKRYFDIKNKTFDDLPDELKKTFDKYLVRVAIYQDCNIEKVSKLVRKLNQHKAMTVSQSGFTWIPTYARQIKQIADSDFFKETIDYKANRREKGEYLQIVCRAVMDVYHLDNYKKEPKKVCNYLEDNSSVEEFNTIQEYFNRIAKICDDSYQDIFVNKNIAIWLAVFDKFTKFRLPDERFAEFLKAVQTDLHSKVVNETSYDELNEARSTTDKGVVQKKIEIFTTLMMDYFNFNGETEISSENINIEETASSLVKENVDSNATDDDITLYSDMIEDCVKIDSPIYQSCRAALVAIMAYACKIDKDRDFESWIGTYDSCNFSPSQKTNFLYMKRDFDNFLQKKAVA